MNRRNPVSTTQRDKQPPRTAVNARERAGRSRKFEETRPDPRAIAATVIERVLDDSAYAAAALSAALDRHPQLEEHARALVTELVYTALRVRSSLEAQLLAHAPRGLPRDPAFVAHLLVAAVQILYLDRRAAPIAVDVAVSQIDALRGPRMAGFANAILRRVTSGQSSFDRVEALRQNCPDWLRDRLIAAVGSDQVDPLLGVDNLEGRPTQHPVTLRLRPARPIPEWLAQAEIGHISPLARRVTALGDPRRLAGYAEGDFVIQEEGAQLIALALAAQSGERILDACAGRGQKTTLLAEQVAPTGHVCATDLHPKKLSALKEELRRLGLSGVTTLAVDWSRGQGGLTELYDAALVDAPCTGTGTLRRRPEIALRLEPDDPARLGQLAIVILRSVASRVRPGGRLVYAVCSVLREEAEGVVEAVGDLLEPLPFTMPAVVEALGRGVSMGRLLPGKHGTDGYFLASFRRR
jgi:16S rRNA (cytosine967-C5)-methyltransferase